MGSAVPFSPRIVCCVIVLAAQAAAQQPAAPAAPETFVLDGRVVDLRSEGVPAAKVWTATWQEPDTAVAQAVADGEGYFRIKATRVPGLRVHATGDGTSRGAASVGRTTQVVRVDVHDAATVRGVLSGRDGQPLKDTLVRASLHSRVMWNAQSDARTDGDGRFELARVPLGPVRIAAWVEGEGLAEIEQLIAGDCEVALSPTAGATTDLRIEVAGLPAAAMERARVSLLPYDQGGLRLLPPPLASPRLDATGALAVKQLPDFQYRVSVTADGFVLGPRDLTAEPTKGPHMLKFTATPAADRTLEWRGTVRGPDDAPVAGVTMVMRASNGGNEATATSDAEGKLVFHCPLAVGSNVIVYSTDDRWVVDQHKDEGTQGVRDRRFLAQHECQVDPTKELDLRVVAPCTIEGRLLLADGRPAALTAIELRESRANRSPQWMSMAWTTTQRDGTFRFARLHAVDDPVRIQVQDRAGSVTGDPQQITEAGTRVALGDVRLADAATVEGVVRGLDGKPAPGVRIWRRDGSPQATRDHNVLVEVITDRQGRYRFVGVPAGAIVLQLLVAPGERFTVEPGTDPFDVEAGKTHTFDLQLPAK